MPDSSPRSLIQRLDELNEFERQPVSEDQLQPGGYFAGTFAGEHVAATEFVIGALFVTWGAAAFDVVVGLVIGNALAVLSWALICAPIAVQTRLTLYWYLRRIAGPVVMVIYNLLNAALFCILAGCMITVSASAVRRAFGIEPQTGWLPNDPWFYPVVLGVGTVVVTLAILGFKRLAQFASICSPWMFLMIVGGAVAMLPSLGHVGSFAGLWETAKNSVWTGPPAYTSVSIEDGAIHLKFDSGDGQLVALPADHRGPDRPRWTDDDASRDARNSQLTGFAIAGRGPGEERFREADARIEGNDVLVSQPDVSQPIAVRYGVSGGAPGNLYFQQDSRVRVVPPFRTYVERRESVLGFWHIVAFSWFCNLAVHLGLSDMALFRFAKRASYGFYSAFGMFLGHYLAWICCGIMGAAVAGTMIMDRPLTQLDSGEVAYQAMGVVGLLAVVLAGWTTANPTLYRAGLALQVISPGWPRWLVTLAAGAVTTLIACSPFVFRHLLGFVAIYGIVLMPVGAIVVTEHWIFPRIGLTRYWSARKGQAVNWPALLSWLVALVLIAAVWAVKYAWNREIIHEFFLAIPVWILTTVVYTALAALAGARQDLPELPVEKRGVALPASAPAEVAAPVTGQNRTVYWACGAAAAVALAMCVALPASVFLGWLTLADMKSHLVLVTAVYFVAGTIWFRLRQI